MKFLVAFLLIAVVLGVATAGFIGGGGWSPGYRRVVYSPSYSSGWNRGYGGWNRGYGGWSGGWGGYGSGWNRGYGGGWW